MINMSTTRSVDLDQWQRQEIKAGIAELDAGEGVSHDEVSKWLKSWGKETELKPPVAQVSTCAPSE